MLYVNARFLTQNITGVQRFAANIALELKKINKDIVFLTPKNIIQTEIAEKLNAQVVGVNTGHAWEQLDLPLYLYKNRKPLLLNLCNTAPILYKNKVVTLHDIIFIKYPQSFSKKFILWYNFFIPAVLSSAKHIITVSDFSKNDIVSHFKLSEDDISVVYNAVDQVFLDVQDEVDELQNKDYFLAVSSPNYHKNFQRLIEAFVLFNTNHNNRFKLKIIGSLSNSFKYDNGNLSCKDKKIEFLGRVTDLELKELYRSARAFVFPSLYEGFGIPPLEAQACGCIVLSSNAASLPEVLEHSAIFFDPLRIEDMQSAMDKLVSLTTNEKKILHSKALCNLDRFSWGKSADKIVRLLKNMDN